MFDSGFSFYDFTIDSAPALSLVRRVSFVVLLILCLEQEGGKVLFAPSEVLWLLWSVFSSPSQHHPMESQQDQCDPRTRRNQTDQHLCDEMDQNVRNVKQTLMS